MTNGRSVAVNVHGRVRAAAINRPESRNGLNLETLRSLWQVLQDTDADDGCGALILTGAGDRAFNAGAEIEELAARA